MSRYRLELATAADDADLRHVLRETPMSGHIAVSFRREPSYFAAAAVDGTFHQVIAARDSATDHIVGFSTRSVRNRYVNGKPQPIGYLSTLRLLAEHRNRGLVARGYAYLRRLHADGRTGLYLTTIAAGNETALKILTSGRTGLPNYHYIGDYHTLVIPIPKSPSRPPAARLPSELTVRRATAADLPAVLTFLHEHGPKRQFFPCYEPQEFFTADGTFRDFQPAELTLALRSDRLVGTLGAWNQSHFRQSVVHQYSRTLNWSRPLYNGWARLRGLPQLPPAHQPLRYCVAALPVVASDDAEVCRALLRAVLVGANGGDHQHLLLGLHASDPLMKVAARFQTTRYTTRIYVVCWPDGEQLRAQLDGRPPYLELGSL